MKIEIAFLGRNSFLEFIKYLIRFSINPLLEKKIRIRYNNLMKNFRRQDSERKEMKPKQ